MTVTVHFHRPSRATAIGALQNIGQYPIQIGHSVVFCDVDWKEQLLLQLI
jgi:hypothetical protein